MVAPGYAELTIRRRQVGEDRPDLTLAEWFSGRPPGPGADAVWDELEKGAPSPFLKLVRWDSDTELETLLVGELKAELGLSGDEDENGFEASLGAQPYGNSMYFNFRTKPEESIGANAEKWQILSPVRAGERRRRTPEPSDPGSIPEARPCVGHAREAMGSQDNEANRPARHPLRRQSHQRQEWGARRHVA